MNLDRHVTAHRDFFRHLVTDDGDWAEKHREFYDEYLAVMDLTAEFYLQTVETVFIRHALPQGRDDASRRARSIPAAIRNVALLTVEGENDDISGVGQTQAAHASASSIPAERKAHYLQPERRPLRRLQRLALPRRDRAAHRRFHRHFRHAGHTMGRPERRARRTAIAASIKCDSAALGSCRFLLETRFFRHQFPLVTSTRGMKWFILMHCVRHGPL